jgi:cytidylate kinase
LGEKGALVAEGRDMGTVIFPGANLKFFLSADPVTRAKRRYRQMLLDGQSAELNDVLNDMLSRDRQDSLRKSSPLKPDEAAVIIDSSELSLFQVETIMIGEAQRVFGPAFKSPS